MVPAPEPDSEAAHYWHEIAVQRGRVIHKLQQLLAERPGMEFYRYHELAHRRRLVIARLQQLITQNNKGRN